MRSCLEVWPLLTLMARPKLQPILSSGPCKGGDILDLRYIQPHPVANILFQHVRLKEGSGSTWQVNPALYHPHFQSLLPDN